VNDRKLTIRAEGRSEHGLFLEATGLFIVLQDESGVAG